MADDGNQQERETEDMLEAIEQHFGVYSTLLALGISAVGGIFGGYLLLRLALSELRRDVKVLLERDEQVEKRILTHESSVSGQLVVLTDRLRLQEVVVARMDERWLSVKASLDRMERILEARQ